jgi:hypothetical protein
LATSHLRVTASILFQLNTCYHGPYVTSSLTKNGSVVHNFFWASPAQSFSGQNPAVLMTAFYSLKFETPPTWRTRSPYLYPPPPETEWPSYTPKNWCPFRRLLRLAGSIRLRLHKGVALP